MNKTTRQIANEQQQNPTKWDTTSLPSVEERVKTICDCRKGSMDDKQYEATVKYNLTQDRNQAYTSLVEGIEGVKLTKKVMHDHEYIVKKTPEEILTDIIENVVKPLYNKTGDN